MTKVDLLFAEVIATAAIAESILAQPSINTEDAVVLLAAGAAYHRAADEVLALTGRDPRPAL